MARREMSTQSSTSPNSTAGVWRRVQERIGRGPRRKPPAGGGPGGKAADSPLRARFFPTGDEDLDSLLSAALNRPTLRDMAERETDGTRRLHDRTRNDPAKNPPPKSA